MREKKFRAWDASEREMVPHVKLVLDPDGWLEELLLGEADEGDELMQYTGLKDKNGKEIYEGDIVKALVDDEYDIWEIAFIDTEKDLNGWNIALKDTYYDCEVIGNINENPELLNESK